MNDSFLDIREGFRNSIAAMTCATSPPIPFDDIPTPHRHTTYVQLIMNGGFFASCYNCGSESFEDRDTLAEAEHDAIAHGELRHVYSRQALEMHEEWTLTHAK